MQCHVQWVHKVSVSAFFMPVLFCLSLRLNILGYLSRFSGPEDGVFAGFTKVLFMRNRNGKYSHLLEYIYLSDILKKLYFLE